MTKPKTVISALSDPDLLGPHFWPPTHWARWRIVLKAVFGLPLEASERPLFKQLFGHGHAYTSRASEVLILSGRGSGKTKTAAAIVVMMATLFDWTHLKRKARAVLLAVDREQSQEAMAFIDMFFNESPKLRGLIAERTKQSITLKNRVVIQIRTASARGIRGPSIIACVADECCFWKREPLADSDQKIFRALRPALGKVPGSMLVAISSTGARDGVAYELATKYHGKPDAPVRVCIAKSTDLNITKEHAAARAREFDLDPYSAAAEYDSAWLTDEAAFISRDRVTVTSDKHPAPPLHGPLFVGCDPNGGSEKGDAFSMAAAWIADGRITVGLVEARSGRRDPTQVVEEFASLLRPYRHRVTLVGDRYGAAWVPSVFKKHGLVYHPPHRKPRAEGRGRMSASDYYLSMLGRLRVVDWPDDSALLSELFALVRTPSGVTHPAMRHDDRVNAAARAIHAAGLYLDRHTVVEPDDLESGEPFEDDETDPAPTVYGLRDLDWRKRRTGVVFNAEPALPDEPEPDPDSLRARLARSRGNVYDLAAEVQRLTTGGLR